MNNRPYFHTDLILKFISKNIHVSLCRVCLVFIVGLLTLFSTFGQAEVINIDSLPSSKIPLSEFSISRKFDHEIVTGNKRYYDFGITLNVFKVDLNPATTFGISPFLDIHIVDNKGYNKYGFRVFAELKSTAESSYKLAFGPARYNDFSSGFLSKKVEPLGFTSEFSYFISPHFGLTFRYDLLQITYFNTTKTISDVSIGINVRPTGLVSVLGYLFGLGSMGFNGILRSQ